MQRIIVDNRIGVRPGTRTRKMTPEEEDQLLKDMAEDDAAEEAEREADLKAWREAEMKKGNNGTYYGAKIG